MLPFRKRSRFFVFIPLTLLLALPLLVMLLWNHVAAGFFNWPHIDYLQALGLWVLCRILFGGFPSRPSFSRRRHFRERFMAMAEDEREKLIKEWKERMTSKKF